MRITHFSAFVYHRASHSTAKIESGALMERAGRHLRANQERQSRNVTNLACVELRLERMFCILALAPANLCERNATLVSHPLDRSVERFIFT